jgi:endogenous inhibitor of DNA gyrase (YacG/DUF329 family)
MSEPLDVYCPYCGELVELDVDEGGASRQAYVEDCPICCRPWSVEVMRHNDGTWTAMLRTEDE